MSLSVQTTNGVWPRRDVTAAHSDAVRRDKPTVADRTAGANAKNVAADAQRLAALRSDAAATAAASTAKSHTSSDDTLIAARTWTA
jgi:hypothetical protein